MERKPHGLGVLKMSEAWKNDVDVFFRQKDYCFQQFLDQSTDFLYPCLQIEADVHSDLVVSASCSMDFLAGIAYSLSQKAFDVHVYVLEFLHERNAAFFDRGFDFIKGRKDCAKLLIGKDINFCKHFCMGSASGYILFIEFLVETDRCAEFVHGFRGAF